MNKNTLSIETECLATPQDYFDLLDPIFRFKIDVNALSEENTKCDYYYTPEMKSLKQPWIWNSWLNPPHDEIGKWVEKACRSAREAGATVVCLLPVELGAKWWHDYCCRYGEIYHIKGLLKLSKTSTEPPFSAAVVVFRPKVSDAFKNGLLFVRKEKKKIKPVKKIKDVVNTINSLEKFYS